MQISTPCSLGVFSFESPDASILLASNEVGSEIIPGEASSSPLPIEESSESIEEVSEEYTSEPVPADVLPEETSDSLPEELASEELVEYVTEVIYQSEYSSEDLLNIENSLNNVHGALQIIACLLVVIIVYIVLKLCRSILDTLGF